jgi:hypothetical protein
MSRKPSIQSRPVVLCDEDFAALSSPTNVSGKLRESFESNIATNGTWSVTNASGDIITVDGNALAASYGVVSLNPLSSSTSSVLESLATFTSPIELSIGASLSQRTLGQEFAIEVVSTESPVANPGDIAISSISQTTTTLTVNTSVPHNIKPGMRIGIRGCNDSRLNYPALVVATAPTATQFTVTAGPGGALSSLTTGVLTTGFVYFRSALGFAPNGTSMIFENQTATNASFYIRSESGDALPSGTLNGSHSLTVGTSASVIALSAPLTYVFQPTTEYKLIMQPDRVQWSDVTIDSVIQSTARVTRNQVVPDSSSSYKFRVRATNSPSMTTPVAQIVTAVKTGTTTATVTTDVPHGLSTTDVINIYGIRDTSGFPNLVTATAVSSVVNATTFTVVIGTAVTATSFGGYVARVNGGNTMSTMGALTMAIQTVARTNNILTVTGSATWSGAVIGDYVNLVGCRNNTNGATLGIDGAYRVSNIQTTTLTLEPINNTVSPTGADFGATNCGGGVIKRTDLRITFVRVFDFDRQRVETISRPSTDIASATPVVIQGGTATFASTMSGIWNYNYIIPTIAADVASAAITTTTTTAAITPASGTSYTVNIPVTIVSGTNPTLDVSVEESDDSGTNWHKVYDFPRITSTGIYRSPTLSLKGNRIRYVQTVGGTTPSFTRAINRLASNEAVVPVKQSIDRSIDLTTLNSSTAALNVQNCSRVQLVINIGAATTPPQLTLQGSDDNGISWYNIGTPLAGIANSTTQLSIADVQPQLIRAVVSSAGNTVTPGYILVKGY